MCESDVWRKIVRRRNCVLLSRECESCLWSVVEFILGEVFERVVASDGDICSEEIWGKFRSLFAHKMSSLHPIGIAPLSSNGDSPRIMSKFEIQLVLPIGQNGWHCEGALCMCAAKWYTHTHTHINYTKVFRMRACVCVCEIL